jgi:hypothetical protein
MDIIAMTVTLATRSQIANLSEKELAAYLGTNLVDDIMIQPESTRFSWAVDRETTIEAVNDFVCFINLGIFHAQGRICPSKRQDDVWHTFLLNPIAYYNFCMRTAGRLIGHNAGFGLRDGEAPVLLLEQQYTHQLWQEVYGEPHPAVNEAATRCHDTDCDFGDCNLDG